MWIVFYPWGLGGRSEDGGTVAHGVFCLSVTPSSRGTAAPSAEIQKPGPSSQKRHRLQGSVKLGFLDKFQVAARKSVGRAA